MAMKRYKSGDNEEYSNPNRETSEQAEQSGQNAEPQTDAQKRQKRDYTPRESVPQFNQMGDRNPIPGDNFEQHQRRQSQPRPTVESEQQRMQIEAQQKMMMNPQAGMMPSEQGGVPYGTEVLNQPIGREQALEATQILQKYKEGKANLDKRIVDNEQWYKLRHWGTLPDRKEEVQPTSAWLFNAIANKHADAMDSFPAPNVLPREESDKATSEMLTAVLPVVLAQNDFEQTYSDVWQYKLKTGTGVYGVFWDSSKLNGLGDISIKRIDILNLFWEPGITDIQKSRHFFHVELADNDVLMGKYPNLVGKLKNSTVDVAKYVYDDSVDTSDKSVVVDWYYKKSNSQGKPILHFCKYVNDVVLFATENDPFYADRGFYDHGKYPFEFDVQFPIEGSPAGFGYIDVGKSVQEYIDRGNQAIMKNMLAGARPRYFIRKDGAVNESEYADMKSDFIHVDGQMGQDSILPVTQSPLSSIYLEVLAQKIDELKETTGNRDVSTGGTTGGVTAASGIAAMQEASSKLARDSNKSAYRTFRRICLDCIELIRQFYDLPRCFRIMGERGTARFIQFSNAGMAPQNQGNDFGIDMGLRIPLFDVEVSAERKSPYSRMSQNELALQFYQFGFFNPQMADQALTCLDMMDFDRKEFIETKISQNGGMLQQLMAMAQLVDKVTGSNAMTTMIAQQYGMPIPNANPEASGDNRNLGGAETKEPKNVKDSKERVAESTQPR